VATHITIEDEDDRPQRMVSDPDRYFADARQRAEKEVRQKTHWLPARHRKQG
jgi:hypothetical protein